MREHPRGHLSTVHASESAEALPPTGGRAPFYLNINEGFHNGKSDYSLDRR